MWDSQNPTSRSKIDHGLFSLADSHVSFSIIDFMMFRLKTF